MPVRSTSLAEDEAAYPAYPSPQPIPSEHHSISKTNAGISQKKSHGLDAEAIAFTVDSLDGKQIASREDFIHFLFRKRQRGLLGLLWRFKRGGGTQLQPSAFNAESEE